MFDVKENHILTRQDIEDLNKQGHELDPEGFYVIKFLFNDKWNNAVEPGPFRVKTSLIPKLAKDAIGMPYVVTPNGEHHRHLRGTDEGRGDTARDLLAIQAKYSIGTIKAPIITSSNNVYGIIDIWPEFRKDVEQNKIPAFVSPTIAPLKFDGEGFEDAQFLNLNAVSSPGYPQVLAGVHAVCKGGIKKCMEELAPYAAAGSLNATRSNAESFSKLQANIGLSMSAEEGKTTPSLETLAKEQETMKSEITSIRSDIGAMSTKLEAIATAVGAKGDTKPAGAAGADPKNAETVQIPKELENNEFVKTLAEQVKESKKSLEQIKSERDAEKKKQAEATRKAQAVSIVSKLIQLKQVKAEDKDKETEKYFKLSNEDGSLKDLEALDNYLKSTVTAPAEDEQPFGASGPEFSGDRDSIPEISNMDALEATIGGPNN